MADAIRQRHGLLVNFLRLLGADETRAQKEAEGLEHYIDTRTLGLLARLVDYANRNPQWWSQFQKHSESV
jgi:DtxR family manganese transport transcriptional regulator